MIDDILKIIRLEVKSKRAKCARCDQLLKVGTLADLVISKSIFYTVDDEVVEKEIFHPSCLDKYLGEFHTVWDDIEKEGWINKDDLDLDAF